MGQCQAGNVEQMEQDFTAIQIQVKTMKELPKKVNDLEAKIRQIKSNADSLTRSVQDITKTIDSLKGDLKV